MGSKKQTTTSNSTQQAQAWAPTQPYLEQAAQGLGNWMEGPGATAYQGQRVADLSDTTRQGLDMLKNSSNANAASGYYNDVLSGKYLNEQNPYLSQLQDSVRASVMPTLNSQFSANGLFGSSAHQGAIAREMGRAMADPLFQSYENERNRQGQAAAAMPGLDQVLAGNTLTAGNIYDQHAQANLDAQRQQWEEQRAAPVRGIQEAMPLLNQLGQTYGTQTTNGTQTQKTSTPLAQQIMGGAMMGAQLFSPQGMIGSGISNLSNGAPWSYGNSWEPWVKGA